MNWKSKDVKHSYWELIRELYFCLLTVQLTEKATKLSIPDYSLIVSHKGWDPKAIISNPFLNIFEMNVMHPFEFHRKWDNIPCQ